MSRLRVAWATSTPRFARISRNCSWLVTRLVCTRSRTSSCRCFFFMRWRMPFRDEPRQAASSGCDIEKPANGPVYDVEQQGEKWLFDLPSAGRADRNQQEPMQESE